MAEIHRITIKQGQPASAAPPKTWAGIVAQPPIFAPNPHLPPRKPEEEITIRPTGEPEHALKKAANSKEIMEILSPILSRAAPIAARRLRSGDIRVTLQNKAYALKNRASLQHQLGVAILQEDFPIEILAVPKSLAVAEGKSADNTALLKELAKENKKLISDISFTKVRWIPQKKHSDSQPVKTRSSLILSVGSLSHQREVVRQGLLSRGRSTRHGYTTIVSHLHDVTIVRGGAIPRAAAQQTIPHAVTVEDRTCRTIAKSPHPNTVRTVAANLIRPGRPGRARLIRH